jgi:heme/copper-type cytochrome/quinol oxidase subunit 2
VSEVAPLDSARGALSEVEGRRPAAQVKRFIVAVIVAAAVCAAAAQDRAPNRREVALLARDHRFIPNKIEVTQDDLVRITFTSESRPASFAVDAYRISKRAGADKTIVFEFRADQAGTFSFYCSLTSDPLCKDMKGTLIVSPK